MKRFTSTCWSVFGFAVSWQSIGGAQVPTPTPRPLSSQLRQKMRAEILKAAMAEPPKYSNNRPDLALPLAQIGDFQGALRLLKYDFNAPRAYNSLWHWRALQLARARKPREMMSAVAQIRKNASLQADAILFAVRDSIERGSVIDEGTSGRDLKWLLLQAAPYVSASDMYAQKAYAAYLWARGGDTQTAERLFERTLKAAQRTDIFEIKQKQKNPDQFFGFAGENANSVLRFWGRAGLLRSALQQQPPVDEMSLASWIARARSQSELEMLERFVEAMPREARPTPNRILVLFALSFAHSLRGDQTRGRYWLERAQQLDAGKQYSDLVFYGALYLRDSALQQQALQELRSSESQNRFAPEGGLNVLSSVLPLVVELNPTGSFGYVSPLPAPRLEQITAQLNAMPASELQFRTLGTVARQLFEQGQTEKILPVARAMERSLRQLAAEKESKRQDSKTRFLYWPREMRWMQVLAWLRLAGDNTRVEQLAREFVREIPDYQRPYAAMGLTQLGLFEMADSVFNPKLEIARMNARSKQSTANRGVSWNEEFWDWDDFAAIQARYRAPEAPLNWIGALKNDNARTQALRAWVSVFFEEPLQPEPYVRIGSVHVGGFTSAVSY